ncbi:MAG: translocation/assembly module TamB domain-containing protein [Alistipes putredinis]|nr:MAG: translocation/assembly module TamB domain-containing protein [Alistipes putredinis]
MNYTDDYQRRPVPVECLIYLSDRLSQPTVRFDVQVPTADTETKNVLANALNSQESVATQFFWLLAFKSFISEGATTAQTLGAGSFGSTATGFQLLSNSISNWLSTSKYNIIVRYIPQSETANDEFDFGFSKELIDNRLILEIEGNYMVDRASVGAASNASNLTGDFYLTWLIDRAGNLKLKGFSQTIDRFDENQGLQENGIGIYYKKDF